jgi:hypothetical protein
VAHIAALACQLRPGSRTLAAEDADGAWGLTETLLAMRVNQTASALGSEYRTGPSWMRSAGEHKIAAMAMTIDELNERLARPRVEIQGGGHG